MLSVLEDKKELQLLTNMEIKLVAQHIRRIKERNFFSTLLFSLVEKYIMGEVDSMLLDELELSIRYDLKIDFNCSIDEFLSYYRKFFLKKEQIKAFEDIYRITLIAIRLELVLRKHVFEDLRLNSVIEEVKRFFEISEGSDWKLGFRIKQIFFVIMHLQLSDRIVHFVPFKFFELKVVQCASEPVEGQSEKYIHTLALNDVSLKIFPEFILLREYLCRNKVFILRSEIFGIDQMVFEAKVRFSNYIFKKLNFKNSFGNVVKAVSFCRKGRLYFEGKNKGCLGSYFLVSQFSNPERFVCPQFERAKTCKCVKYPKLYDWNCITKRKFKDNLQCFDIDIVIRDMFSKSRSSFVLMKFKTLKYVELLKCTRIFSFVKFNKNLNYLKCRNEVYNYVEDYESLYKIITESCSTKVIFLGVYRKKDLIFLKELIDQFSNIEIYIHVYVLSNSYYRKSFSFAYYGDKGIADFCYFDFSMSKAIKMQLIRVNSSMINRWLKDLDIECAFKLITTLSDSYLAKIKHIED